MMWRSECGGWKRERIAFRTVALAAKGHGLTPSGLLFFLGSRFFYFVDIFLRMFEHGYTDGESADRKAGTT